MSFKTYREKTNGDYPNENIVKYTGYGDAFISRYSSRTFFADICVPLLLLLNIQAILIPTWREDTNALENDWDLRERISSEELGFGYSVTFPLLLVGVIAISIATVALLCRATEFFVGRSTRIQMVATGVQALALLAVAVTEIVYKSVGNVGEPSSGYEGIRWHSIVHTSLCTLLALVSFGYKLYNLKIRTHRATSSSPAMGELSANQRQLLILVTVLIIAVLLGGGLWVAIEDRTFESAIFFSIITITSIGMDAGPQSTLGRLVLFAYASMGMVLFGLTIYAIRLVLLDMFTDKLVSKLFDMYLERQIKRQRKRHAGRKKKAKRKGKEPESAHELQHTYISSQSESEGQELFGESSLLTSEPLEAHVAPSTSLLEQRSSSLSSMDSQTFLLPIDIPKATADVKSEKRKYGSISVSPIGDMRSAEKLVPLNRTHYKFKTNVSDGNAASTHKHQRLRKALSADMSKSSFNDLGGAAKFNMKPRHSTSYGGKFDNIFAPQSPEPRRRSFSYSLQVHNPSFTHAIVELPASGFKKRSSVSSKSAAEFRPSIPPKQFTASEIRFNDYGSNDGLDEAPENAMRISGEGPVGTFKFPDARPATMNCSSMSEDELDSEFSETELQNGASPEKRKRLLVQFSKKQIYWQLGISFSMAALFLCAFSMAYCFIEQWNFITAMYFCFSATSTIGYGDISLTTVEGRTLFIWMVFFGVGIFTWFVSVFSDFLAGWWKERVILGIQSRVYNRIEKRKRIEDRLT